MHAKRSVLFITGQTVDVAEVPTHLVISMRQPFKAEDIYRSQQVAAEWLANGGVLLVNDDGTGLKMISTDAPETVVVEAERQPGGVIYANDPEGISHANHCECSRCEKGRQPQDIGTITADLPASVVRIADEYIPCRIVSDDGKHAVVTMENVVVSSSQIQG